MDERHMKEIFSDEAFVKDLLKLENPADVQATLKEKGIDIPESEIAGLKEEIAQAVAKLENADEVSLSQLDDVAGGSGYGSRRDRNQVGTRL